MTAGAEVEALAVRLEGVLADRDPIKHTLGRVGKDAAHATLERALGPDRAFSGLRRRVRLNAGYDLEETGVTLNLRPKGLVILADKGRRRTTRIRPRRRSSARALTIPGVGYRASAMSRPSRGHDVIARTIAKVQADAPDALAAQVARLIETST